MIWFGLYAATALVVGAALFVLAEFHRDSGAAGPQRPGVHAMAAGFLWPVLLIALAQCGALVVVRRRMLRTVAVSGDVTTRIKQPLGSHLGA